MGFMQILDRVCIGHSEDFHSGGFRAADTRERVFDHQAGFGGDERLSTLSIQPVEGVEKGLRIGLSSDHIFCAGDVKKFFSEPCLFKNHLDFMTEGAGCDGQRVGSAGFTHELAHPGKNDQMIRDRFQVRVGFSLHQLRNSCWVGGMFVCGECCDKAAQIVVPQVVGIVVGLSQRDADFSQRLPKTSKMEWLRVRDHAIKVKDHRCQCGHEIDSRLWVWLRDMKRADYSTGRAPEYARMCLLGRPLTEERRKGQNFKRRRFSDTQPRTPSSVRTKYIQPPGCRSPSMTVSEAPARTIGPGLLLDESANNGILPPGAISSTVMVTFCPSPNIGSSVDTTGATGLAAVWGGGVTAGATGAAGAGAGA